MMDLRTAARALGGEVSGRGIVCPGPGHSARDRSLSVLFSPSAPGCFIVRSHAGDDDLAAKDWVRSRLGLDPRDGAGATFQHHSPAQAADDVPTSSAVSDRTALALQLWREARQPTESPVARYLARRGLSLVDDVHEVLRSHPSCPFAGNRTRAMIALVRNIVTDEPQAVHRTALDLAGNKIEVNGKDRLALGPIANGAVKLTVDEEVTNCLGVGEGIETTLSLRCLPEFGASPVWSLLNAAGIASFPVLSGIECLWIAVDDDPAGRGASDLCADRWRWAGREVWLVKGRVPGSDLNDIVSEVRRGGRRPDRAPRIRQAGWRAPRRR